MAIEQDFGAVHNFFLNLCYHESFVPWKDKLSIFKKTFRSLYRFLSWHVTLLSSVSSHFQSEKHQRNLRIPQFQRLILNAVFFTFTKSFKRKHGWRSFREMFFANVRFARCRLSADFGRPLFSKGTCTGSSVSPLIENQRLIKDDWQSRNSF